MCGEDIYNKKGYLASTFKLFLLFQNIRVCMTSLHMMLEN